MEGPHLKSSTPGRSWKDDILNNMTPEQALIIMDWATKFPSFGVQGNARRVVWRGLSWHVTAVITKPKEDFEVFSTGISNIWLWAYEKWCMMLCLCLYVLRRSDNAEILSFKRTPVGISSQKRSVFVDTVLILLSNRLQEVWRYIP